jgi:hypothetical protein
METIRLRTNQPRLIQNLKHAFNQTSMLGELLQHARRARARRIAIVADDHSITVTDDGIGIDDLQTLIHIAESGWDAELQAREHAFGMGVLSTLYFANRLVVHSGARSFDAATDEIILGAEICVHKAPLLTGTKVRLVGVESPFANITLIDWVRDQLERLCEAFPIPVSFNGTELPRPLADPTLEWRETEMGRVLINLEAGVHHWRAFLQYLPLGHRDKDPQHIILLRDDVRARLPDRQSLLSPETNGPRIAAALRYAYRGALLKEKQDLGDAAFIEHYAEQCLLTENGDLLTDIPFASGAWFRDWENQPPGFTRDWDQTSLEGSIDTESLQGRTWTIEEDEDVETFVCESYISARSDYLLQETRLPKDHWLMLTLRSIRASQVTVLPRAIIHRNDDPGLLVPVMLVLVDGLKVRLEGEADEYEVPMIRVMDTIYLTSNAWDVSRLVHEYVFDDHHEEELEKRDDDRIAVFTAVGRAKAASDVVRSLLPDSFKSDHHPKLAGARVLLTFDEKGKLKTITD